MPCTQQRPGSGTRQQTTCWTIQGTGGPITKAQTHRQPSLRAVGWGNPDAQKVRAGKSLGWNSRHHSLGTSKPCTELCSARDSWLGPPGCAGGPGPGVSNQWLRRSPCWEAELHAASEHRISSEHLPLHAATPPHAAPGSWQAWHREVQRLCHPLKPLPSHPHT